MSKIGAAFKIRYAISHGIVPAGIIGTVADIGTPVGLHWVGWIIAACYLLALVALYWLPAIQSAIYDLVCAPEEARKNPFFFNPFAIALLSGAAVGALTGTMSYVSRDEGGYLSANVDMVLQMQPTNLLLQRTVALQEEISDKIGDVKRETSEDPAKELANLGFPMATHGLSEAVNVGNAKAVHLFADAGVVLSSDSVHLSHPSIMTTLNPVWRLLKTRKQDVAEELAEALARFDVREDPRLCLAEPGYGRGASGVLNSAQQRANYRTICAGGEAEQQLRDGWQKRQVVRSDYSEIHGSCTRDALGVLSGLRPDIAEVAQIRGDAIAKFYGGSGEIALQDAVILWISENQHSGDVEAVLVGGAVAYRVRKSALNRAAEQACELTTDPTHEKKQFSTLDEDYEAMIAALDEE